MDKRVLGPMVVNLGMISLATGKKGKQEDGSCQNPTRSLAHLPRPGEG
ncbi:hypothetical protein LFML04_0005 [Leptospirillum ferriphilum ML-04]|uniref:Uncharacterized protein n=1 Tax=Leptospirillum ferriphilum (strain ML-04) TaxID=1048260 RepID=J9Z785_LEPFM|nr:hypothetical protein LFML04_0005 [Leptospirillum ferriphilum ML-04]